MDNAPRAGLILVSDPYRYIEQHPPAKENNVVATAMLRVSELMKN